MPADHRTATTSAPPRTACAPPRASFVCDALRHRVHDAALPPSVPGPGAVHAVVAADGRRLRYREVTAVRPRHRLVVVPPLRGHAGWALPAAWSLRERGCSTWTLDRRGVGLDRPADGGRAEGDDDALLLVEDVLRLRERLGEVPVTVAAFGWSARVALAAAVRRPDRVRAVVLVAPDLAPRLGPARRLAQRAASFAGRDRRTDAGAVDVFGAEPRVAEYVRRDPWRPHDVSARLLRTGDVLARRLWRDVRALRVPVLAVLGTGPGARQDDAALAVLDTLPPGTLQVRRVRGPAAAAALERTESLAHAIAAFLEETVRT